MTAEAVQAASMAFKHALIERVLGAELSHDMSYPPGKARPEDCGDHRNGLSGKTALTGDRPVRIEVLRDREGTFEPLLIPKHERRFTGFDDKIVAMYARGMPVRGIQGSLTNAMMAEVAAWQGRPLEPMYPVACFDALRVKICKDAVVRNKAIYLALGVLSDGTRDVVSLWIEQTEGAKYWPEVPNDLKTRGVGDILIAFTDGLPEALTAVFPATTLQTCIVHLLRDSLDYVSRKDRKQLAAALRPIYTAAAREAAARALDEFEASAWGQKHPTVVATRRRAWDPLIPFFAFAPEIRRVIYTTNAIESLHSRLRKFIKTRGHFPSGDAARNLIKLALRNITANWSRSVFEWRQAMNQFAIAYSDRLTQAN